MVIAMVNWVQIARVVYTETTALAEREFVLATVGFGAGSWRILRRHIREGLPGIVCFGWGDGDRMST